MDEQAPLDSTPATPLAWAVACGAGLLVALACPPDRFDGLFWGAVALGCAGAAGWAWTSR